jgi:hypothetical protein
VSSERESQIEQRFTELCRLRGWQCLKLNLIGRRGWPDRMVLVPEQPARYGLPAQRATIVFVELKRIGERPRPLQRAVHQWLKSGGFNLVLESNARRAVHRVQRLTR